MQAAKNTFLLVAAFTMASLGFLGMLKVAPEFTIIALVIGGVACVIHAVYRIEKGRIECEQSEQRLRNIDREYQ